MYFMVGEHIPFYITSEFCEKSQTNELAQQASDFKSLEGSQKTLNKILSMVLKRLNVEMP